MQNRRDFLKTCIAACAAMAVPAVPAYAGTAQNPIVKTNPQRALVVWYSQTGHTRRIGAIIRHAWNKAGLMVDGADYREIEGSSLKDYDLIAIGAPVHYSNVPRNLQDWIRKLPPMDGTSVVSYVTFGGDGPGNPNPPCSILEQMTEKGGASAGFAQFGNMSTYAPFWSSLGQAELVLRYKDLPNETTYQKTRIFAAEVLSNVSSGKTIKFKQEFGLRSLMAIAPQRELTKLMITHHHIETSLCIRCGTCLRKCPVGAINLNTGSVDSKRCIACMGCINNCPARAMRMNFMGKPLYGFREFLRRKNIEITEPVELRS